MAEFIRAEEKVVNIGEPVIFENNTDSDFSVSAAIVFRKSGLYDVSIVGRRTIISKVAERPKGEWLELTNTNHTYVCSVCGRMLVNITDGKNKVTKNYPFCHCGADMRGAEDE